MTFQSERTIFDSENLGTLICHRCNKALLRHQPLVIIAWGKQRLPSLALSVDHAACQPK